MKTNRTIFGYLLVLLLGSLGLSACNRGGVEAAREGRVATVSPAEQDFMMKASQANLSEINMSRLALQKTDNTDVRDYATMIQSDHTHAFEDLSDLMRDKNVTQTKTLAPDTKQDIDRMTLLTGPEFDREFMNMMVADHEKAVELFRDQAAIAMDADIKKLVDDMLPTLEMHLDKAHRLQSRLFSLPKS